MQATLPSIRVECTEEHSRRLGFNFAPSLFKAHSWRVSLCPKEAEQPIQFSPAIEIRGNNYKFLHWSPLEQLLPLISVATLSRMVRALEGVANVRLSVSQGLPQQWRSRSYRSIVASLIRTGQVRGQSPAINVNETRVATLESDFRGWSFHGGIAVELPAPLMPRLDRVPRGN